MHECMPLLACEKERNKCVYLKIDVNGCILLLALEKRELYVRRVACKWRYM